MYNKISKTILMELKRIWKKLGINGQVKNYSNIELWIIETDTKGSPIARILKPGYKTPANIDSDALKRKDGKPIQGHRFWWKFYDFSTVEVFKDGRGLRLSVISKTAVNEDHFNDITPKYQNEYWGEKMKFITDIKKDSSGKIILYKISDIGWVDFMTAFEMTCNHQIDNARPVFRKNGNPYIRSKRDKSIINNFSK